MAVNQQLYNPYNPFMMHVPVNGLVKIDGIEGAQMYQLPPDSVSPPLFLADENAFIIKTTDGGGAATIRKYVFEEEPLPSDDGDYVTKQYFDGWVSKIMEAINGQHPLPRQAETDDAS